MNKAATAIFATALGIPAARAAVNPALLALAPADSKLLIGIQVDQVKSAPFGQYLISQVKLDANADKALAAAGFDPVRDVSELLFASNERDGALLLGRGSFHPDKIHPDKIAGSGQPGGVVLSTYRGAQLIEAKSTAKDGGGALAFLDASTVIAGDAAAVRAAIDRHAMHEAFSGTLAARARQISSANDVWLASLEPPAEALAGIAQNSQFKPIGNVLESALQLSAGLKFGAAEVTLSAEILTRSADDAQQMAALLRIAASFLQSSSTQGSNQAGQGGSGGAAAQMASQITTSGPVAILAVSFPERQLEQLISPGGTPRHHLAFAGK